MTRPPLLPLDDALAQLLAQAAPLAKGEAVATFDADGRVLLRDAVSPLQVPPLDNSAMDGYAFAGSELEQAEKRVQELEARQQRLEREKIAREARHKKAAVQPAAKDQDVPLPPQFHPVPRSILSSPEVLFLNPGSPPEGYGLPGYLLLFLLLPPSGMSGQVPVLSGLLVHFHLTWQSPLLLPVHVPLHIREADPYQK